MESLDKKGKRTDDVLSEGGGALDTDNMISMYSDDIFMLLFVHNVHILHVQYDIKPYFGMKGLIIISMTWET